VLIFKSVLAIVLLPVTATVIIPIWLLRYAGNFRIGWGLPSPWFALPAAIGIILIAVGLYFLISTIHLFLTIGRGTLAPWHPPQTLVVEGPYRFVRNPMITGVIGILLGESILFGSLPLFLFFLLFALLNGMYIPWIEEPALDRRFGAIYAEFKRNVPRWIPRYPPWNG
jgi:protein-S-isoprenylcysteine O-methyltransferase Ste14